MSKKSGTNNPLRLFNPTEYARLAVGPLSRKIGFSNFRRFIDFEPIEYDRITFLVGRNNSGKSTVVKALMLVVNYLKAGRIEDFDFANDVLESANIVTYDRAKNRLAPEQENFIRFVHGFGTYEVRLTVTGEAGMTTARVEELVLIDHALKITFTLNPAQQRIKLEAQGTSMDVFRAEAAGVSEKEVRLSKVARELNMGLHAVVELLQDKGYTVESNPNFKIAAPIYNMIIEEFGMLKAKPANKEARKQPIAEEPRLEILKKELSKWSKDKTSKEYIELNQELEALKRRLSLLSRSSQVDSPRGGGFSVTSYYPEGLELQSALDAFLSESRSMTFDRFKMFTENKGRKSNELKEAYSNYVGLQSASKDIRASVNGFFAQLNEVSLYYLGASSIKQPALYAIRDRNNTLAQAIHEYRQLGIKPGETAHLFLINWLKEESGFEVGDAFEIVTRAGEAYEVNVTSHGTKIPLSDKGMGSIQAMLLLFRLACIIHKTEKNPAYQPIVIIEEPELNLHPALQSRLADLFLAVHRKHGVEFIIETHSEYAIRKTQALVKQYGLEDPPNENPFTVLYFDKDALTTWKMKYRPDGRFENEFGKGFYDISGNLTLDLI